MDTVRGRQVNASYILLFLAFVCFVIMFLLTSGLISSDEYKSIPLAWLSGGLSLYVLASLV